MKRLTGGWLISSSGSQAINAVAGMLTNVVYARALSLDDVGLIALVNAIGMFATVFVDRGIGAWMTRALAAGEVSFFNALHVVIRAARPSLLFLIFISVLLLSFGDVLPESWSEVTFFSILFVFCFWVFQVGLSFTQGLNLSGLRSLGIVLNGGATLLATAVALWCGGGLAAALVATLAAYLVVGLLLIAFSARARDTPLPHRRRINPARAIRTSRALFGSNIVTYAVSSGDVLLASVLFSSSEVGQYQIAKKVAQATVLPLTATLPMVLGKMSSRHEDNRRFFMSRFIRIASVGFSAVTLGGSLALPTAMPLLFGDSYAGLALLTLVLTTAFQFQFLRDLLSVYSNSRGIYGRSLLVNILTAVAVLALVVSLGESLTLELFAAIMVLAFVLGFTAHLVFLQTRDSWGTSHVLKLVVPASSLIVCLAGVQVLPWLMKTWGSV